MRRATILVGLLAGTAGLFWWRNQQRRAQDKMLAEQETPKVDVGPAPVDDSTVSADDPYAIMSNTEVVGGDVVSTIPKAPGARSWSMIDFAKAVQYQPTRVGMFQPAAVKGQVIACSPQATKIANMVASGQRVTDPITAKKIYDAVKAADCTTADLLAKQWNPKQRSKKSTRPAFNFPGSVGQRFQFGGLGGVFGEPVFSSPPIPVIRAGRFGPVFSRRPLPAGFPGASI